jgi:outer membrane murein-binding lipoprotein Lpp
MRRTVMLVVVATLCVVAAGATGLATRGTATADAAGSCQLGTKAGQVKHVIYLQFDNTHYRRDRDNVASDLEQMPNLLNFLKDNGTLLTNDHTILISHTAGGILSSLTGLYPDRMGQTVSNSFDYFRNDGTPTFTSSFKYWTDTVDGSDDSLPNMVGDGGQTAPAPWLTYTHAGCNVGGVSAANIELENNNAVTVRGGPTALVVAAAAGATNIKVASVSGFSAGQAISVDGEAATISTVGTAGAGGTGITLTAPLAGAHASGTVVYGTVATDQVGDMTRVFGEGSPEWNEAKASQLALSGTAARALAQTDFVGYAIHCAQGQAPCAGNPHARPDDATIVPGSNDNSFGLFGAKYVDPAIAGGQPCVKATDGSDITDPFNQCGFPGFDGALAKNSLGMVAAMQEHGIPVTYAYISDAHDNHVLARASGPGEADYKQQLSDYNDAFGAFFKRLKDDGIDKSNTLFVVTVDEGDHFAGGIGTPSGNSLAYAHTPCGNLSACPANQIGEITTNLKSFAPAGSPAFDLHFDDAPTIYVNGQPSRTDPSVRKLERDLSGPSAVAVDPYQGGATVPLTQRLADTVEENTLHMVNADPKRTPTFTLFGNADFFFQASNSTTCAPSPGTALCVDPKFAWNHGDYQDEIANTWLGIVGPGVTNNGIDSTTWTDHVDVRPTMNAVLGLGDDYTDDGRVITEVLSNQAQPNELNEHSKTTAQLGAMYKAINAPFGKFALDTLVASTTALQKPDTPAGNLAYDQIEAKIANLTAQRNVVAGAIRAALNDAARGTAKIDESNAKAWINQGQALLDAAAGLAATP